MWIRSNCGGEMGGFMPAIVEGIMDVVRTKTPNIAMNGNFFMVVYAFGIPLESVGTRNFW